MAKYNWQRFRLYKIPGNITKILHYGRQCGKTYDLLVEAINSNHNYSTIVCINRAAIESTKNTLTCMLDERRISYRYSRGTSSILTDEGKLYRLISSNSFDGDYSMSRGTRISPIYYLDNIEYFDSNCIRALKRAYLDCCIKTITLTDNQRMHFEIRDFFEKILARNKNLYYYKTHDEQTISRYINFGYYSSRDAAENELRPGRMLAS